MRTITIKSATDVAALKDMLVDQRVGSDRADLALDELRAFNPQVKLEALAPDTVLFVPDTPAFKATAGTAATDDPLGDLRRLATGAFGTAAAALKAGNETRAAERTEVAAVLKGAALKRAAEADPAVARQRDDAVKALAIDKEEDAATEGALASLQRDVLAAITRLAGRG